MRKKASSALCTVRKVWPVVAYDKNQRPLHSPVHFIDVFSFQNRGFLYDIFLFNFFFSVRRRRGLG